MPEMFVHTRRRRSAYYEATVAEGAIGPDAARLAQVLLCLRDLTACAVGQGKYVASCSLRPIPFRRNDR